MVDQASEQALRTKLGCSQTDLALGVEMDRNYLSLIELSRSSPRACRQVSQPIEAARCMAPREAEAVLS